MIRMAHGNLLDADVDALVNTVNTVGVMGKGIALMFKERFPENYEAYAAACKRKELAVGRMFVTESPELKGPRWIINFPTKAHWRNPSKIEWIESGLQDLHRVVKEKRIKSIAIPPLGSGNGGLNWHEVRPLIEASLSDLHDVEVVIYEPTPAYLNVSKTTGVEKLTPARALIAEAVRRYEVLGFDCSILEVQKLAWALTHVIKRLKLDDPLKLQFKAGRYGPYADNLRHLLNNLDGSYLHSDKRLADAGPSDVLHFSPDHHDKLAAYFRTSEGAGYIEAARATDALIDGFQSPLGMETLATVGWLLEHDQAEPNVAGVRSALNRWPTPDAAERKQRLFNDKLIQAAVDRLTT
ncbi:MAG TPA: macro domain-containing protein [Tepidisphaeraceae bacterium]|nr:macro domain-containing protein [Tepidisphaeraceae bacterium]